MSRATISTGGIDWSGETRPKRDIDPGYALVLGDFSGSASRGENPKPRLLRVDRDNVEEIFAKLAVQLRLPLAEQPLAFAEPDELHPDFLYQRFELFAELRGLRRRLQDRATFAAAAAELTSAAAPAATAAEPVSLDDLLASAPTAGTDIQQLIQSIVAPYVEPAPDPQQTALLDAVDAATAELLRALLHQPDFRALEASWRGLQWWLRRLDSDTEPQLLLCDCNRASLPELLAANGPLDKLLAAGVHGATPPKLVLADFQFNAEADDIAVARALAEFAQRHDTHVCAGASERFAGCETFAAEPDPVDWTATLTAETAAAWEQLRQSPAAEHLLLVTPRWLLRLPYGRRTSTIESFEFEELTATDRAAVHTGLLWGNGAWLAALALCNGVDEIGSLPLYQWREDGETQTQPSVEALLNDRAAAALAACGLMAVRGVAGGDSVRLPRWNSCAVIEE